MPLQRAEPSECQLLVTEIAIAKKEYSSIDGRLARLDAVAATGKLVDPESGLPIGQARGEIGERREQLRAMITSHTKTIADKYGMLVASDSELAAERERLTHHRHSAMAMRHWTELLCDMLRAAGHEDLADEIEAVAGDLTPQACEYRELRHKLRAIGLPTDNETMVRAGDKGVTLRSHGIGYTIGAGQVSLVPGLFGEDLQRAIDAGELTEA